VLTTKNVFDISKMDITAMLNMEKTKMATEQQMMEGLQLGADMRAVAKGAAKGVAKGGKYVARKAVDKVKNRYTDPRDNLYGMMENIDVKPRAGYQPQMVVPQNQLVVAQPQQPRRPRQRVIALPAPPQPRVVRAGPIIEEPDTPPQANQQPRFIVPPRVIVPPAQPAQPLNIYQRIEQMRAKDLEVQRTKKQIEEAQKAVALLTQELEAKKKDANRAARAVRKDEVAAKPRAAANPKPAKCPNGMRWDKQANQCVPGKPRGRPKKT